MRVQTTSSLKRIKTMYFRWLCSKINRRGTDPQYQNLAGYLHKKEFYGTVPNDDNRAIDGMKLRESFCDEVGFDDPHVLGGNCTMLEMLVALSMRMDFLLADIGNEDKSAKWFWLLINNLGLILIRPDDPEATRKKHLNDIFIKKFLERSYAPDGKGGLFPVKKPQKDQRQVEIWQQLQCYIDENYPR